MPVLLESQFGEQHLHRDIGLIGGAKKFRTRGNGSKMLDERCTQCLPTKLLAVHYLLIETKEISFLAVRINAAHYGKRFSSAANLFDVY